MNGATSREFFQTAFHVNYLSVIYVHLQMHKIPLMFVRTDNSGHCSEVAVERGLTGNTVGFSCVGPLHSHLSSAEDTF